MKSLKYLRYLINWLHLMNATHVGGLVNLADRIIYYTKCLDVYQTTISKNNVKNTKCG